LPYNEVPGAEKKLLYRDEAKLLMYHLFENLNNEKHEKTRKLRKKNPHTQVEKHIKGDIFCCFP
jgi:hypothetical protein